MVARTKTYPPELKQLLEKAMSGDITVAPALAKAFDQNPELVAAFGDLAAHAEQALLTLAAGQNFVAREAITRQLADLRSRLTHATTTELEKLLVDRVALSWLAVSLADIDLAKQLAESGTSLAAQAAGKRLDAA